MQQKPLEPLTAVQQAQARHFSYGLFGRLFMEPITAELLPYLREIPELADVLPEDFEADVWAAAHHRLFTYNLFPYASIFLDSSGLLGGTIAGQYAAVFEQNGFGYDAGFEADHLGQAFGYLAYLAGVEGAMLAEGREVVEVRRQHYRFLTYYLLPWLVPCVVALEVQAAMQGQAERRPAMGREGFYGRLGQLALAVVNEHMLEPEMAALADLDLSPGFAYEAAQVPALGDGRTGLRDIARFLMTPVWSGLYLGRGDINRLARTVSLPHGFGTRTQMVETLLGAAGQYELMAAMFGAFGELVADWRERYTAVVAEYGALAGFVAGWQERLAGCERLLDGMIREVGE